MKLRPGAIPIWTRLLLVAAVVAVSGCGDDESTNPPPPTPEIMAAAGANGAIVPSGAVAVARDASQKFEFVPAMGHHVVDVVVDGASIGVVPDYTFTSVTANHVITVSFAVDPSVIVTWAGNALVGFNGDGHPLLESSLYWPVDMTITPTGDTYVLDWNNHRVRKVTDSGTLQTVIGNFVGDGPDDQSDLTEPGAIGTMVNLNHPTNLITLPDGKLLLTAWHNHKLRRYDPVTGRVLVICGAGAGFGGDGGDAKAALLNQPAASEIAPDGSIYILDQRNQRVRRIAPDNTISTVVGVGTPGFSGDGGPPLAAQLNLPRGPNPPPAGTITIDAQGRLYISDILNERIRRVDFGANLIETVAGNGVAGYGGDGGPATAASLFNPRDIEIGPDGRLYIADEYNNRIRVVDLTTGIIETLAGTGVAGFSGDGGLATAAMLHRPTGIEFDQDNFVYIVDSYNHRIRRVLLP